MRSPAMTSEVGRVGVEPTRYLYRRILSPLRLPIPPSPRQNYSTRRGNSVKMAPGCHCEEPPSGDGVISSAFARRSLMAKGRYNNRNVTTPRASM